MDHCGDGIGWAGDSRIIKTSTLGAGQVVAAGAAATSCSGNRSPKHFQQFNIAKRRSDNNENGTTQIGARSRVASGDFDTLRLECPYGDEWSEQTSNHCSLGSGAMFTGSAGSDGELLHPAGHFADSGYTNVELVRRGERSVTFRATSAHADQRNVLIRLFAPRAVANASKQTPRSKSQRFIGSAPSPPPCPLTSSSSLDSEGELGQNNPAQPTLPAAQLWLLKSISHPNILRLVDLLHFQYRWAGVFEWAEAGSLERILRLQPGHFFAEMVAKRYFRHLMEALVFLRRQGIAHRNLSCKACFVTADNTLKLSKFDHAMRVAPSHGRARPVRDSTAAGVDYEAPECRKQKEWDPTIADIYAAGVILHKMTTSRLPSEQLQYQRQICDVFASYESPASNNQSLVAISGTVPTALLPSGSSAAAGSASDSSGHVPSAGGPSLPAMASSSMLITPSSTISPSAPLHRRSTINAITQRVKAAAAATVTDAPRVDKLNRLATVANALIPPKTMNSSPSQSAVALSSVTLSTSLMELLGGMLCAHPSYRFTAKRCRLHRWTLSEAATDRRSEPTSLPPPIPTPDSTAEMFFSDDAVEMSPDSRMTPLGGSEEERKTKRTHIGPLYLARQVRKSKNGNVADRAMRQLFDI